MRNFKILMVVIGTVFCFLNLTFASEPILVDSIAVVSDFVGDCYVKQSGAKNYEKVLINMPVYQGDEFKTGPGSFVEITFDDASIIRLDSNTVMKIQELTRKENIARTIFNLAWGRVLAVVDKLKTPESAFEVHTKMAIAAVKGTELAVETNDNKTALGVYEGVVDYSGKDEKGNRIENKYVEKGKESIVSKENRKPTNPERLRTMLHLEKQFANLREEIRVIREIRVKEGKEGVIKYRIQKKLEKEGKKIGESNTEITVGGTNENIGKVEKRIKNYLRNKIRNEFAKAREHAYEDLKWVNSEMKADLNLGKTMTDVHGNRIRIEEYIFRPNPRQVDLLSLTLREKRLDYLRAQNIFNTDLPKRIPEWVWQKEWIIKPPIYKIEERVRFSNTIDRVDTLVKYGYDSYSPGTIVQPLEQTFVQEPLKKDNIWQLMEYETMLSINGSVKEHRKQIIRRDSTLNAPIVEWIKMPDDKTFKTNTEVLDSCQAIANSPYLLADYNLAYENVARGNVFNIIDEPVNPGTIDLAWKQKRYYNDGSWLETKLYLIDDYGNIKRFPTTLSSWLSLIFDTNVEMILNSNEFKAGDIDIVSQILWWVMLNPKQENVRPDSSVDATAF
jgi:hypothetical protein